MIIKINKEQVSSEVSQVMLKFLQDKQVDFPNGILEASHNGEVLTEEATKMYNELCGIIDDIMNEFQIEEKNEH